MLYLHPAKSKFMQHSTAIPFVFIFDLYAGNLPFSGEILCCSWQIYISIALGRAQIRRVVYLHIPWGQNDDIYILLLVGQRVYMKIIK